MVVPLLLVLPGNNKNPWFSRFYLGKKSQRFSQSLGGLEARRCSKSALERHREGHQGRIGWVDHGKSVW